MTPILGTIEASAELSLVFIHMLVNLVLITAVVIMNGRLEITSLSKTAGYP